MNNKVYDASKFVAQIALPAVGGLYFAVAQIWHLPKAEEIVGTITAVDAFLGILLGISSSNYNQAQSAQADATSDGDLMVATVDGQHALSLGVYQNTLDAIHTKDSVTLKVVHLPVPEPPSPQPMPMN